MKRFFLSVSLGTLALVAPLLSASEARASSATCKTSGGTVISIVDPSTCHFETGESCTSQCTPVNYTTTCSTMCTSTPVTTCTETCDTKCNTACTTSPTTFTCHDQ